MVRSTLLQLPLELPFGKIGCSRESVCINIVFPKILRLLILKLKKLLLIFLSGATRWYIILNFCLEKIIQIKKRFFGGECFAPHPPYFKEVTQVVNFAFLIFIKKLCHV